MQRTGFSVKPIVGGDVRGSEMSFFPDSRKLMDGRPLAKY